MMPRRQDLLPTAATVGDAAMSTRREGPTGEGDVSLTADQIRLVQESYALISRSPRRYSDAFYYRLLLDHPFARALFPDDMAHQIAVFSKTIDVLVENVVDLGRLHPELSALALRHVQYGVKPYHYAVIGAVLIDTFADILADRFTPATRQAWEAVYAETAGVMIADAYPAAAGLFDPGS